MSIIKLDYRGGYVMPGVCCVCGAPAGKGVYYAGGSSFSGKTHISLPFPLCDEHNQAFKDIGRRRRVGCLIGIAPLVLFILFLMATASVPAENAAVSIIRGLLVVVAVLGILGGVIASVAIGAGAPKAVSVKDFKLPGLLAGHVTLWFANEQVADLFATLNADAVKERRR